MKNPSKIRNKAEKKQRSDILNIHGREGDNTLVSIDFIFFNLFFDTEIIILTCGFLIHKLTEAAWPLREHTE